MSQKNHYCGFVRLTHSWFEVSKEMQDQEELKICLSCLADELPEAKKIIKEMAENWIKTEWPSFDGMPEEWASCYWVSIDEVFIGWGNESGEACHPVIM